MNRSQAAAQIVAVAPPRGSLVHLYLPGYQPGGKSRSVRDTAMCGSFANEQTPPPVGPMPTGRVHVPLAEAAGVIREMTEAAPSSPWIAARSLRWCPLCIGRAAEVLDLTGTVIGRVLELAKEADR